MAAKFSAVTGELHVKSAANSLFLIRSAVSHTSSLPIILSFSAADPSATTGIQADTLTLSSLGCHPLTAITALSVQDTRNLSELSVTDPDFLNEQARYLLEDMQVAAFKIGVIGSVENVAVIAEIIADYPDVPVVLDLSLLCAPDQESDDLMAAVAEMLLPHITLLICTPHSGRWLMEELEDSLPDESTLVACFAQAQVPYLLITHLHTRPDALTHALYEGHALLWRENFPKNNEIIRGEHDTLSAAVAAMLAAGMDMTLAVREAQLFTLETLKAAYRPGMGHAIVDRLFWAREGDQAEPPMDDMDETKAL